MRDGFGRNIDYLRISVTDKCNLRCRYCMPEDGVKSLAHKDILSIEEISKIVEVFKELGIKKVRLTGGEPLVRKGILELVKNIHDIGIDDIAMTTNAIKLSEMAYDLKKNGIKRFNISLDTLNREKYSYITRGGNLDDVFKAINTLKNLNIEPIKINTVMMRSFNYDEIFDFEKFARDNILVRFIELMPIGVAIGKDDDYVSNTEIIEKLNLTDKLDRKSEVAQYYKSKNGGVLGFINPISHKFCSECNRVRLDCRGNLIMCLHSKESVNLKEALRSGRDIKQLILDEIYKKPEKHHILEGDFNDRDMNTIGG